MKNFLIIYVAQEDGTFQDARVIVHPAATEKIAAIAQVFGEPENSKAAEKIFGLMKEAILHNVKTPIAPDHPITAAGEAEIAPAVEAATPPAKEDEKKKE